MKNLISLLILTSLLSGCGAINGIKRLAQHNVKNMSLSGKKILMVVAPAGFRDAEYNEPRRIFEDNGAEVKVASIQSGTSVGVEGTKAVIDLTVSEVNVGEYDAVSFIGGPGMAEIISDDSLKMLAKKFYEAGKLTTAICVAPSILAMSGILSGKRATAWSGSKDDLEAGGAVFTNDAVVQDGKIITANGPMSAKMFAKKIVENLR